MKGITEERLKSAHNKIDRIGKKFGRLLVVEESCSHIQESGKKKSMWKCKCDCGNDVVVAGSNLQNGNTKSCGCLNKQILSDIKTKHKMCKDSSYKSWEMMLQRCTNSNRDNYKHYGGRGITVCDRWLKFENFYADMGDRPEGTSIDRIDVNGNYEPRNCKWSTHKEQCINRRSSKNIIKMQELPEDPE